jgi:hypothetical protein
MVLLISPVTVFSSADTMDVLESPFGCSWEVAVDTVVARSAFRRFGHWAPQLMALRKLRSVCGVVSLFGRGEDETMRCDNNGLVNPDGDAPFPPAKANRSHNSSVGSALGVLRAWDSFLTFTAGVCGMGWLGEEAGDELLARFRPRRPIIGEI